MTARDTSVKRGGEVEGRRRLVIRPTASQTPLGTLGCDILADSYRRDTDLGCRYNIRARGKSWTWKRGREVGSSVTFGERKREKGGTRNGISRILWNRGTNTECIGSSNRDSKRRDVVDKRTGDSVSTVRICRVFEQPWNDRLL